MTECPLVRFYQSPKKYLFLLLTLMLLSFPVAQLETVFGHGINSFGLLSSGLHMMYNNLLLACMTGAVMEDWSLTRRCSLAHFGLHVALCKMLIAMILLGRSMVVGFQGLRHVAELPAITHDSLFYLAPVAALLLDLVTVFVIRDAHKGTEGGKAMKNSYYYGVDWHISANAIGTALSIVATTLVQIFGWTVADAVCSIILVIIMLVCSMSLFKESTDMFLAMQRKSGIWTINVT